MLLHYKMSEIYQSSASRRRLKRLDGAANRIEQQMKIYLRSVLIAVQLLQQELYQIKVHVYYEAGL